MFDYNASKFAHEIIHVCSPLVYGIQDKTSRFCFSIAYLFYDLKLIILIIFAVVIGGFKVGVTGAHSPSLNPAHAPPP